VTKAGKGKCSFLKKRTKKLLFITGSTGVSALNETIEAICKSFLVLFFQKRTESSLLKEDANTRAYRVYVLLLLLAVNIHNFLDRQIPFILAESIKRDLHLSDTQLGLMGGMAFAIVYSVLGLYLGHAADRYSRKWVLSGALVIWSLMTAVAGLAQNFAQLVCARLGVAAGEAGSTPAAHGIIAGLFPQHRRSMPMAIFSLGVPLGSMLGLFLGGWISTVADWRTAFFLVGAPGLALALLAATTLKQRGRGRPWWPIWRY
jgi:predicted MFS family arabinose efflux permease